MPTYEYECKSCGHNFEAFQSMSDAPFSDCPQCGKEIRRLINGGSGVIFKGSGFYVNDKRADNSKKHSSKATEKPADKSESGEAKPACAACPASAASGGSCPVSEKAAG
ncbi:MAG: zinc ribbon domain-containing protein [Treponema sp.]|nr:zinc ribbon domain-containing protein [Treponema sp.]